MISGHLALIASAIFFGAAIYTSMPSSNWRAYRYQISLCSPNGSLPTTEDSQCKRRLR
jgi:hypothetical protein